MRQLIHIYKSDPSMYEVDYHWSGFEWIDFRDVDKSIISFVRRAKRPEDFLVFVCNFTPEPRRGYFVGVPEPGRYLEILNSDSDEFGGSGLRNYGDLWTQPGNVMNRNQFLSLTLPPLSVTVYRRVG